MLEVRGWRLGQLAAAGLTLLVACADAPVQVDASAAKPAVAVMPAPASPGPSPSGATQSLSVRLGANVNALYRQHCATCHGAQRTGAMGPALLPESLERLKRADARRVIAEGRPATQMPAFAGVLNADDIELLTAHVYQPVVPAPSWSDADIRASRSGDAAAPPPMKGPVWKADPMNLFIVVEGGDHHVSLLDGDRFEVIERFATRYALHGGPKFSPDGRFVYFGSRDGWITKYDLWALKPVGEVRAGLNMRNIAVSSDGRWVMAANYLPRSVVLFDAGLQLQRVIPAETLDGKQSSRVSAVYDAGPRRSFVVALKDMPELWEISYDPKAEPIHDGLVHDYKMGEAIAKPGFLGVRRTPLDEPLDDFYFDQGYRHVLGATRPKTAGEAASAQVVNLDVRRKIAGLPIAGMPHLGSGITFQREGRTLMASPNLGGGAIDVIELGTWKLVKTIPTPGPGFFMRSHEATPYMWTDSMMSPAARDTLTVIDKRTLEPVAQIKEGHGKTFAHIEFTKDGRYALASVWDDDGALVVLDATTFKEVKRIPMRKPVGKYNLYNKLTKSEGTSH